MTRLIDADAFKKVLSEYEMNHDKRRNFDDYSYGAASAYEYAGDLLDEQPTVELPHGEWVESKERKGHFYCSECVQKDPETGKWRETFDFKYPFCPKCGASMSANDKQVTGKLNSEIENSKSEIVPDYRDGWRMRGEAE